ncbi:glutathione S-transferase N-terminal domain-containing protein [Ponticaulis sp.]|uniref:glutathione S-transferase N-terminal domain-containing protein n=1 Tax=Ponticaulis sp. TaxID=2020902 RepID=UPI000C5C397D|nr:glutathione S-transferase N-terminal domain-containing protein [Ponticaulis sp.]MAF58113.1 glutathione S-transferase [Ponticaulis sp.]MBN05643.1 glutathione S-transferase [Ponticaulis sp.]|tara:strand:- start:335 stop:928 length:594 start_codon:yes stop_codon:yes gene_type:complete
MLLYYSKTSPFARKVRVLLSEHELTNRVQLKLASVLEDAKSTPNPLGKIPCLITPDGDTVYDSPVICEWVEAYATDADITRDDAYWRAQKLQALGDGVMDAAFNTVMEKNRPADQQSSFWTTRWREAIERGVAEAAELVTPVEDRLDRGQVAIACMLGYLDFRITDFDWRAAHPSLAQWYEPVSKRESMISTAPPAS